MDEYIAKMDEYAHKKGLQRSDLTFVDIGANLGWFTITSANYGLKVWR